MSPDHIGSYEVIGSQDRAVDMRLGGKMDHRVDRVALEQRSHRGLVADIAAHELEARIAVQSGKILDVPGIRQGIEHDHSPRIGFRQPMMHEVGTDKSGATRDEHVTRFEVHPTWSLDYAANAAQEP